MRPIHITYNWQFMLHVVNKKGRVYKRHAHLSMGYSYEAARDTMKYEINKKRWTLVSIQSVKVLRIAFAYYSDAAGGFVPNHLYPTLPIPDIPDDLNGSISSRAAGTFDACTKVRKTGQGRWQKSCRPAPALYPAGRTAAWSLQGRECTKTCKKMIAFVHKYRPLPAIS